MTDYVSAYDGHGHNWQVEEAQRLAGKLREQAVIVNGVIRWLSNNTVPPVECVALAAHIGLPVDVAACTKTRDTETTAFLAQYRKLNAKRQPTGEELAEMRAAFGPGAKVVNIITGRVTRL